MWYPIGMFRRVSILAGLLLGLAVACSGGPGDLDGPRRHASALDVAPDTRSSSIVLPTTVSIETLRAALNDATPDPVYEATGQQLAASVVADVTVRRNGDISVAAQGEALRFTVPVRVKADAYRQKSGGGRGVSLGEGRAKLDLILDMTFALDDRWSLIADAAVQYRWTRRPTMSIGPVTVDVKDALDAELRKQIPALEAELVRQLKESSAVRSQVRKVWQMLSAPRTLSRDPEVSVRFDAEGLFASDPVTSAEGLSLTLGARGAMDVRLGTIEADGQLRRLPDRLKMPAGTTTRLFVPLYLPWEALAAQARASLVGQTLQTALPAGAGTATATVTDILDVYPSGDQLAVGVAMDAEAAGATIRAVVWLLGTPQLSLGGETLRLTDFSFAAKTDSAAANVALSALYDKLREAAQEQLVVSLTEPLAELEAQANAAFTGGQSVAEGVTLDGELKDVSLVGVHILEDHLLVDTRIRGDLRVRVSTP